jgi:hypothetical protein
MLLEHIAPFLIHIVRVCGRDTSKLANPCQASAYAPERNRSSESDTRPYQRQTEASTEATSDLRSGVVPLVKNREGPSRTTTALRVVSSLCSVSYSLLLQRTACPERSRRVAYPVSPAKPSPRSIRLGGTGVRSSAGSTAGSRCLLGRHRRSNHAVVARWRCGDDDQLHLARIEPGHIQRSLSRPEAHAGGGLATVCHPSLEDACPLPDPLVRAIDRS